MWKMSLLGLAQDFGVSVDDEPEDESDELAEAEPLVPATPGADADAGFLLGAVVAVPACFRLKMAIVGFQYPTTGCFS